MSEKLRIVFMGSPDFALPSLEKLYETYGVTAVFCQPDKASGRGNKVVFGPVKQFAVDHGIPVYQPVTFKDGACKADIESLSPDLIVVAAYGKILPQYVLDAPKYGCINVHGSLLPKYRGASPIQAAVLNGDDETGITIMRMAPGLDSGDIISSKSVRIGEYETAGELFDRLSVTGAGLLIDTIPEIVAGTAEYTAQDESKATHVTMITKQMGELDLGAPAFNVKCRVYGLNPWPCAYINAKSGPLKIHRVLLGGDTAAESGTVIGVGKAGIEVACGDGRSVIITELQRNGKKRMDAFSFSLGVKIKDGMSIYDL